MIPREHAQSNTKFRVPRWDIGLDTFFSSYIKHATTELLKLLKWQEPSEGKSDELSEC